MATPKLDRMCTDLIKRIPDQLRSEFTPGEGALPNGNTIKAVSLIDYINRGMQQLFNQFWQSTGGDLQKFLNLFPEMQRYSDPVTLAGGNYTIGNPYKDFYKIIGAITTTGKYIKPKEESKYLLYLSEEYDEIKPTQKDPAIIQINQMLAIFPQSITGQIRFHYIKAPISKITGGFYEQNGSEDSPFYDHWNSLIVDIAYLKYLEEVNQTT